MTGSLTGAVGSDYPTPRYSITDESVAPERLLAIARRLVRETSPLINFPRWGIQSGERVLIVVPSFFDRPVLDAICTAIGEVTGRPDVLIGTAPEVAAVPGGEKELEIFRDVFAGRKVVEQIMGYPERGARQLAVDGRYDVLLFGSGGSSADPKLPRSGYRRSGIQWPATDYFASGATDYPVELQIAIEEATWEIVARARRVHVTDAEGTDISWSIGSDAIELSQRRLGLDPSREADRVAQDGHINLVPFGVPLPEDATGVIAGTINHCSVMPYIRLELEAGKLVRLEGGGAYGEGWSAALDALADMQYPRHPGPGWAWLQECALGTNPKVTRSRRFTELGFGTALERKKSGVLHFGIGAALMAIGTDPSPAAVVADTKRLRAFLDKNGAPDGHYHVHNYFATVDVETWGGATVRLVDRGRLAILDSPAIRAVASRHGDPDELLAEAWTPAVPGINVEGDYQADYAADPLTWIQTRSELS